MEEKVSKYLDTNIKDIMNIFPPVQAVLDKFEIGCAPCNLGTCKLRDIIGIHNLNQSDEKTLLTSIFEIIYPGETLDIPRIGVDKPSGPVKSFSPGIKELMEEHKIIKRVLFLVPSIVEKIDVSKELDKKLAIDITDFIKNYADKFHHAKEEDILFKYFDSSLEILKVMINDHSTSRGYVAEIVKGAETGDNELVKINLIKYCELLTEHIKKEDEILYPWLDGNMNTRMIGEMYSKFANVNSQMREIKEKFEALAVSIESRFS